MMVLALDLSGMVGWCVGPVGALVPEFGAWPLPPWSSPDELGRTIASYENELLRAFDKYDPVRVAIEAPFLTSSAGGKTNAHTMTQQIGLYTATLAAAYRWKVWPVQHASSTVRAKVIGRGRFAQGEAKEAVTAWCYRKGWQVPDHNAGDAAVLWQFETRLLDAKQHAIRPPGKRRLP
jgi:Holliday junction resolvasome RuvABC endonuclease subunit